MDQVYLMGVIVAFAAFMIVLMFGWVYTQTDPKKAEAPKVTPAVSPGSRDAA
ncbi:MAG TPA: hypothetical protein VG939_06455 [Caulobacteraceae bacterium]|nr:hypothetical protein [Caulobacteraceae bacterium]